MKLLNYTSIRYLLFTALLLLLSIPVGYFVLNRIFTNTIDRDLHQQAREIPFHQGQIHSVRDLDLWRSLDKDLVILPADSVKRISGPFTKRITVAGEDEQQDFRILQKEIHVLGKRYVVGITSSLVEKEALIRTILLIQLGIFCLLLAGAVIINYFINKKVWRAFYQTLAFLESFNLERPLIDIPEQGHILEFRKLNDSVYRLAVDIRKTFLNQKEFTENASHELQTPLAILKSKLELLLQDQDLSQNQSILIGDMYKVIERLEDLNTNLLFLSKMDNNQFAFNDDLSVEKLLSEIADELTFMVETKSQEVRIDSSSTDAITGNRDLIKILITNLLRNAIQHSSEGAMIEIKPGKNYLQIRNPGSPINFDTEKIFNRFTKSSSQKGNGLGLAIAKKIATLHGWQLVYKYENGKHRFDILFTPHLIN